MKVSDLLHKRHIIADLEAREKREVLEEMADMLADEVDGLKREELVEVLLEREKLGSTGIGHGVAIPHAKIQGIEEIAVAFGRSRKGIDFQSMDKKPVQIFFLIVAPENSTAVHLKVLASISRLLKDNAFRKRLLKARDSSEIFSIIKEEDDKVVKGVGL